MNGNLAMGGLLASALMMGAGLWYSTQFAHYESVDGLMSVEVQGEARPVAAYRGLDGDSSPLKLRACFTADWAYPALTADVKATPLKAPYDFGCFDARQIETDLSGGKARALLAAQNQPFGFDRVIAQYPDGRAFMWRQMNVCGERHFAGEAMPADCPSPDAQTAAKRVISDLESELLQIKAISTVSGQPDFLLIEGAPKIATVSTGEHFHACFTTSSSQAFLSESFELAEDGVPVEPRGSFPCFKAETLAADIDSGVAMVLLGQRDIIPNIDRMIAVYPDGRAFAWHQKGN